MGVECETDDASFPAAAYRVEGYRGIAWYARGWEVEPDEDTKWTGQLTRTGRVVLTMVGDDRRFVFDIADIAPIPRESYCGECGQLGCTHDGLERT